MAYTKQTWTDGDVITAEKLNHIEDGIADIVSPFLVTANNTGESITIDKTFAEIATQIDAGNYNIILLMHAPSITKFVLHLEAFAIGETYGDSQYVEFGRTDRTITIHADGTVTENLFS